MKKLLKKQKGITLIALVITIVVLIILASVAINITVGENGIFNRATQAKEQFEMAAVKEKLNLAILEVQTGEAIAGDELTLDIMLTKLQEKLPEIEITKDGETLKGNLDGYDFVIDSDFKVTIEGYNEEAGNGGSEEDDDEQIPPQPIIYTVTFDGENVTSSGASSVEENASYTTTLTPATWYEITSVEIKMGDTTLTGGTHYTYENGIITIASVTGNLTITVTTEEQEITISNPSTSDTLRTGNSLSFTWEQLGKIANEISDNSTTITNNTSEMTLTIDGTNYIIGVGDYTTVNYNNAPYTVRIVGFNHDTLASDTTKTAGISFVFEDIIYKAQMNTTDDNTAGWGGMPLRTGVNNITLKTSEGTNLPIKEVQKTYLLGGTTDSANPVTTPATSNDKLWLLSCSEIWDNARESAVYGCAAGEEGEQYKYYKMLDPESGAEEAVLIKKYTENSIATENLWWLRSTSYLNSNYFCGVYITGVCDDYNASYSFGVVPGFAI